MPTASHAAGNLSVTSRALSRTCNISSKADLKCRSVKLSVDARHDIVLEKALMVMEQMSAQVLCTRTPDMAEQEEAWESRVEVTKRPPYNLGVTNRLCQRNLIG